MFVSNYATATHLIICRTATEWVGIPIGVCIQQTWRDISGTVVLLSDCWWIWIRTLSEWSRPVHISLERMGYEYEFRNLAKYFAPCDICKKHILYIMCMLCSAHAGIILLLYITFLNSISQLTGAHDLFYLRIVGRFVEDIIESDELKLSVWTRISIELGFFIPGTY